MRRTKWFKFQLHSSFEHPRDPRPTRTGTTTLRRKRYTQLLQHRTHTRGYVFFLFSLSLFCCYITLISLTDLFSLRPQCDPHSGAVVKAHGISSESPHSLKQCLAPTRRDQTTLPASRPPRGHDSAPKAKPRPSPVPSYLLPLLYFSFFLLFIRFLSPFFVCFLFVNHACYPFFRFLHMCIDFLFICSHLF